MQSSSPESERNIHIINSLPNEMSGCPDTPSHFQPPQVESRVHYKNASLISLSQPNFPRLNLQSSSFLQMIGFDTN